MKYFLDTEFFEDGKTIELISIALRREDDESFYAINEDADYSRIEKDEWMLNNVLRRLPNAINSAWMPKEQIKIKLLEFIGDDKEPEFWADYASYDWIVLCQLFGRMIDLPKHFPMFCMDIQQLKNQVGFEGEFPIKNPKPHDAQYDARECKQRWEFLQEWYWSNRL